MLTPQEKRSKALGKVKKKSLKINQNVLGKLLGEN